MVIDNFSGEYYFLSNYYTAQVVYNGLTYQNNEAAFQSMKCINEEDRIKFTQLIPSTAKRLGRSVKLRPDWEQIKEQVMEEICYEKFIQNPDICQKLLNTAPATLIEGNTWGDKVWGVCNGEGENKLGIILMRVRDRIFKERNDTK